MVRDARKIDNLTDKDRLRQLTGRGGKTREMNPFTESERDKILGYFAKNESFYYPFIFMLFWTGMRPSEVVALRIGDVDLARGFASITKSRHMGEEDAQKPPAATARSVFRR